MKIALCTDSFFPTMGGTEFVVDIFARKLISDKDSKNEVAVFTQDFCKNNANDKDRPYKIFRTKSTHIPYFNENICKPYKDKKFEKAFLDFKPDVVHIHTPLALGNWAVNMSKRLNVKSILTLHTRFAFAYDIYTPFSKKNFIHKKIVDVLLKDLRSSCKNADILTTVSESSKENEIKKSYAIDRDILVIRNGFDVPKMRMEDDYYIKYNDKSKLTIVYAGRIDITKNLDFSLSVIKGLTSKKIPVLFLIAGEGIYKNHLKKISKKLEIENNIKWLGRLNQEDLLLLHSKSDIFLFPSIFDNDSIAAIEARYCGCPTIAIKNTGTAERIKNGVNGFAVDNDINSFIAKIEELYNLKNNNYIEYMSLRNNTKNLMPETWDEVLIKYKDLYNAS